MDENKQVANMNAVDRITEAKLVSWMEAYGVAKQLQPNEKKQFMEIAMAYQLNPFKREIYCNAYGEGQYRQLSIITGYEVYLKRADRTGDLAGWNCSTEGSVENKDLKAVITIHRKSWNLPLVHEVEYSEYIQTKKDGTPTKFWSNKPKTMIKKVAMAQGFRLAFPDELGGMPYTSDELPGNMTGAVEAEVVAGNVSKPQPPQQKGQTELTKEELEAKTAKAREEYKKPIPPPVKEQGPTPFPLTATGFLETKGEANKGGYVAFTMDKYQTESGKDMKFSTKDAAIIETLSAKMEAGEQVSFEYTMPTNPNYASSITQVVNVEESKV